MNLRAAPDEGLVKGSAEMKCLAVIATFCICLILAPLAIAQQYTYKPPLGDIMGKVQLRHIKLWFAGKLANWQLAAYEVDEIKASLESAADLYRGFWWS